MKTYSDKQLLTEPKYAATHFSNESKSPRVLLTEVLPYPNNTLLTEDEEENEENNQE